MEDSVKIVGIAGLPRSGKDSLGELFVDAGFYAVSFGEIFRDYSRKRHADKPDPISIANMTETANWLRTEHGPDVALKEALRRYKDRLDAGEKYAGLLFISIRAPIEVDFILQHGGELIWVQTDDKVRYERNNEHRREGETELSFEEFLSQEALQSNPQPGTPEEAQMNTTYVRSKATKSLENNGNDFDDFKIRGKTLVDEVI